MSIFHPFPDLDPEVQSKIWEYALLSIVKEPRSLVRWTVKGHSRYHFARRMEQTDILYIPHHKLDNFGKCFYDVYGSLFASHNGEVNNNGEGDHNSEGYHNGDDEKPAIGFNGITRYAFSVQTLRDTGGLKLPAPLHFEYPFTIYIVWATQPDYLGPWTLQPHGNHTVAWDFSMGFVPS
ncbi:hypothetical protein FSST1_003007 [Fusarium sambucinum]